MIENLGWDVVSVNMSIRGWTIADQTKAVLDKVSEVDDFDLIMGSSYGGLAVANAANELLDRDLRLVLMAPAFGLAENFQNIAGKEGLNQWENNGFRPYFHHGLNKEIKLSWDFMVSAKKMSWPEMKHPTVIIHGISDEIVSIESSRKVEESNSNVELIEVDDGHRLGDSLQFIPIAVEKVLSKK
jgi:pimeloyl-ACP methyl ester carboxylesterase